MMGTRMQPNRLRSSLLIALLTPTSMSFASGYKINEQSASGVGNAYAGRAAVVEDASVVFYNPAGMAFMEKAEISTGLSYVNVDARMKSGTSTSKYGNVSTENDGDFNDGGDFVPDPVIPFFYATSPVTDKIAVGVGVYVPFGAASDYEDGFIGQHFADKTLVQGVEVQPTIAYKFNDQFAVGFGLDILHMKGELTKSVDTRGFREDDTVAGWDKDEYRGYEGTSEVKGQDWGYGYNLSLFWKMTENTNLGVVYRSAIDLTLEGKAKMTIPGGRLDQQDPGSVAIGSSATPGIVKESMEEDAKVDVTTPQNLTVSLSHRIEQWTLQTGVTWTEWSKFENFDVKSDGEGSISTIASQAYGTDPGYIIHIPEKWKDTISVAVGASYQLNDDWMLRSGYAYDESPIQDDHVTARIPSTDRHWITAGFRYRITPAASVDFGAAYLFMDKVTLDEYNYNNNGDRVESEKLKNDDGSGQTAENFKAEYETNAFGLSAQLNWQF